MDKSVIASTLNMPNTKFEMKANLSQKEPIIRKKWLDLGIYNKLLSTNSKNKQWILHDGPPYANGNLHLGHALNKILKDIIIRSKNSMGFYSPFIMGWDTHGLPIEHAVSKKMGSEYNKLSASEKRQKCYNFALENIEMQKNQFEKFGLFTDFNKIYLTMSKDFESRQLDFFLKLIEKKLVYQDLKPVYWSWSSQTALADAEIEYKDMESDSIFVTFDVAKSKSIVKENDKILIWTTTPWTIPSNLAVAVHPQLEYCRIQANDRFYIVAKNRIESLSKSFNWTNVKILDTCLGTKLEHVEYCHPLYRSKINPIILAEYVSADDGTGLVHNAPGFGADDYLACKKYQIKPFCPIDKLGKFANELNDPTLETLFYEQANPIIIERLKASNNLLHHKKIIHSAAIDWRTKKPIIYRSIKQWFIDIKSVKSNVINCLKSVSFTNQSNKDHMIEMINGRDEWCISRQRIWGVPIAIIYENEQPIFDVELNRHIVSILKKEGTNTWFDKPVEYFLNDSYRNKNISTLSKCLDTADVWFDSGSSHLMLKELNLNYPCDLYLEGNDQYRGWFNSSVIISAIANSFSPYKQLVSHGMVVDEQGRKMSKSLGNGIDPLDVVKVYGADVLRIWVANSDYESDISIGDSILKQVAETYRRIRNSLFRFCLSNLNDFDYKKDANFDFNECDAYVLNQLNDNIIAINKSYETFNFKYIVKTINTHVVELSSWYFDLIKDSLYCDELNNHRRKTIQTVLFLLVKSYMVLLYPIIPHTASEAYEFLNDSKKQLDVAFEPLISKLDINLPKSDNEKWKTIFEIKNKTFVIIEQLRSDKKLNKNNEAKVTVSFNNGVNISESLLKSIMNVAEVKIINTTSKDITVDIIKTSFVKCIRCWNYFESSEITDDLCQRCQKFIK